MPISMSDLMAQVAAGTTKLDTGSAQIESMLTDAATLTGGSATLMRQAAEDAAFVSTTKSAADIATQQARQAIGLDFGTDRDAQNQIYSGLAATESAEWQKQQAAKAKIDAKSTIDPLADPLGWIMGKLTINQDIAEHNAANQNRQAALDRIKELNQATSSSAVLQSQFSNTVTVASAEAAARIAATEASVRANQFTVEGLKYNVEGVKEALQASAQKLSFLFSAKNQQTADAHLALSIRAQNRADEEFAFKKEQKLADDKYDSSIIDSINAGRAIRGVPPITGVRTTNVLAALKGKGPGADEFIADWKAGENAYATGSTALGSSPAEVLNRLSSGQIIAVSPAQELVKQKLGDALTFARTSKSFDPKDVVGATKLLNQAALTILTNDAKEVKPDDASNLFSIAPISTIVRTSPAAAETPVYQKVLKPLMDTGVDMNNVNNVMSAVITGLKKGTINYNDALSLTTIYQAGSNANLAQRDLEKFGFPSAVLRNIQYQYNVRIGNPGFGSNVIDVTKPDVLGRYLNKRLVGETLADQTSAVDSGN